MAKQLQLRKGTDTEHNTFTGALGEVTVDTTNKTLRVHDGSTVGGIRLATLSSVVLNNTLTSTDVTQALTAAQGKVLNDQAFGVGQTWQDVTTSRAFDTNYTNSTGRPIMVNAAPEGYEVTDDEKIAAYVNGVLVYAVQGATVGANHYQTYNVSFIVPAGAMYRIVGLNRALFHWAELR